MRNYILLLLAITVFSSCNQDDDLNKALYPTLEEELNVLAEKYVKVGAIVGVIDSKGIKSSYSFGSKSVNTVEPPDANTVFDIGSITKTFTALLAAKILEEEIILNGVVEDYLPEGLVSLPTNDGVEITFEHLLTHMSGLPRTPHETGSSFPKPEGYDAKNPYAAYSTEYVYTYLTNYCQLEFTPGTYWGYSNTGYGLLGHTLGLIDGSSYEDILIRNIFDVLGMNSSSLFLTNKQMENVALAHDRNKNQVPFFTAKDIFQGAGMIKSSLNDMFKYLEANMGLVSSPLKGAMDRTHQQTPDIYTGSMGYIGLAWYIIELEDRQTIIYSGGNTNGHASYIAFNPQKQTGVIVLFNDSQSGGTNLNFGHELMMALDNYQ